MMLFSHIAGPYVPFIRQRYSSFGNEHVYSHKMQTQVKTTNIKNTQTKKYVNKKGQLSLTNPRDACETFARFMYEQWGCKLYS